MRTITKLADPQPHGAISECVSGEFAVVGFDIHQNVIDANITFHGKYIGDTVKFGDRYFIIHEARVVNIKDEWWWILDVEEDAYGEDKLKFDKAWHFLGRHTKSLIGAKITDPKIDLFDYPDASLLDSIRIIANQLTKTGVDYDGMLGQIALAIAILYSREVTEQWPNN